jgi:hypothetical protein
VTSLLAAASLVLAVSAASGAVAVAQSGHADLSKVRVLALAPFEAETYVPRDILDAAPARLGDLIARAPYRVVPAGDVAAAMKRLDIAPRDLIGLTRTVEVGTAVGADAVLTGRITLAQWEGRPRAPEIGAVFGVGTSRVDMDVRVLEVATRLKVFERQFSCQTPGPLPAAMDCVIRRIADRLIPRP